MVCKTGLGVSRVIAAISAGPDRLRLALRPIGLVPVKGSHNSILRRHGRRGKISDATELAEFKEERDNMDWKSGKSSVHWVKRVFSALRRVGAQDSPPFFLASAD